jgi:hypothetical protein
MIEIPITHAEEFAAAWAEDWRKALEDLNEMNAQTSTSPEQERERENIRTKYTAMFGEEPPPTTFGELMEKYRRARAAAAGELGTE